MRSVKRMKRNLLKFSQRHSRSHKTRLRSTQVPKKRSLETLSSCVPISTFSTALKTQQKKQKKIETTEKPVSVWLILLKQIKSLFFYVKNCCIFKLLIDWNLNKSLSFSFPSSLSEIKDFSNLFCLL